MNILNINESNEKIIEIIKKNKPFSIVRLGAYETFITVDYLKTKVINTRYLQPNINLNGIYSKNNDIQKYKLFCEFHNNAIKYSDLLASFTNLEFLTNIQNQFSNLYQLPQIHSRSLEPFYTMMDNQIPWTHSLLGKKVLIINPFVESFQKQLNNGFQIFKDKRVFLEGQEFVFYKSFNTIAGNHIHNDWFETFNIMCKDISN